LGLPLGDIATGEFNLSRAASLREFRIKSQYSLERSSSRLKLASCAARAICKDFSVF